MQQTPVEPSSYWSAWQVLLFRFCFPFILLITAPWAWIQAIPSFDVLLTPFYLANDWLVHWVNAQLLHVKQELVPKGGSGDTSFGWAELYTYMLLSLITALVWTLADYRRKAYVLLHELLYLIARYFLAMVSFQYGFVKLFLLQMPFPGLSELSTPLGDFLPMRLSWMFVGYSGPYQFFSGCMEVLVGILLFFRRTSLLGALLALGVYTNVMVLNLSYDIPVKLFSMELVVLSLFLLAPHVPRLYRFFIQQKGTEAAPRYQFPIRRSLYRWARVVLKLCFVVFMMVLPFIDTWQQQEEQQAALQSSGPIRQGIYEVAVYVRNGDTLQAGADQRWNDIIFDARGVGSIAPADSAFRIRYGRGYFRYEVDSQTKALSLSNPATEDLIRDFRYQSIDSNSLQLWAASEGGSLYLLLQGRQRHFPLTERQFHWLSEANR